MRKIILILTTTLLLSFNCSAINNVLYPKTTLREEAKKDLMIIALLTLLSQPQSLDYAECYSYRNMPGPNALYFTAPYYPTFFLNTSSYTNFVLGDSTMDISIRYTDDPSTVAVNDGFITPSRTYGYPVGGNTSCDIQAEFATIRAPEPQFILIATAGGNDIASATPVSNSDTIKSIQSLLHKTRDRFPHATIIVVGIHPTGLAYVNANKVFINNGTKNYVNNMTNAYFYDPLPLFGVAEGQASNPVDMLDSIHYAKNISFALKNALQALVPGFVL